MRRIDVRTYLSRSIRALGLWALRVGSDPASLEPTRRLAAVDWLLGAYLRGPSAAAKHRHLLELFHSREHRVFIEAGTYRGDTVAFFVPYADSIVSIELQRGLYAAAVRRFANEPKVSIVYGDALTEIPRVVGTTPTPPLVFLDGHFSGEGTATGEEMEPAMAMLAALGSVAMPGATLVIDDLRMFGSGLLGFPQLDEITTAVRGAFPHANIRAGLDSIVIECPIDADN